MAFKPKAPDAAEAKHTAAMNAAARRQSAAKTLSLTATELEALKWLLVEESQRMDDDGNEGAFDRSPLQAIYSKVKAAER
jgi:hypothetical protein